MTINLYKILYLTYYTIYIYIYIYITHDKNKLISISVLKSIVININIK